MAWAASDGDIILDPDVPVYWLGDRGEFHFDPTGLLTLSDVLELPSEQFERRSQRMVQFNNGVNVYWWKFALEAPQEVDQHWIFNLSSPHFRQVDFYLVSGDRLVQKTYHPTQSSTERSVLALPAAFNFELSQGQKAVALLRVELSDSSVEIIPSLHTERDFYKSQSIHTIILSIYFGSILLMATYNLILYFQIRVISYCYYALFIFSVGLINAIYEGIFTTVIEFIPVDRVLHAFAWVICLASLIFVQLVRSFLNTRELLPGWDVWLKGLVGLSFFISIVVSYIFPPSWFPPFLESLGLIFYLVTLWLIIKVGGFNRPSIRSFFIANLFIQMGIVVDILLYVPVVTQWLGSHDMAMLKWMWSYSFYVFTYIEMILLSLALGQSFREIRTEKRRSELAHNALKDQYAKDLELDIAEATAEIKSQSEKLEQLSNLKSSFLANISHEFRTPLTLIQGTLKQLERGKFGGLSPEIREALQVPMRNSVQLQALIEELLKLAELDAGVLQLGVKPVDLSALIRRVAGLFVHQTQERDLQLQLDLPEESCQLVVDSAYLEKILSNLIQNSIKYNQSGHQVKITLQVADHDTRGIGTFVLIHVDDDGPGVDDKDKEAIFERFNRLETGMQGYGIGLSLAKELMGLHGGDIFVSDSPLGGARFTLELPVGSDHFGQKDFECVQEPVGDDSTHFAVKPSEVTTLESDSRPLLLLAEDNPDMQSYLAQVLEEDFRLVCADNGQMALDQLSNGLRPQILLSDIMMPQLDGIALLQQLRAQPEFQQLPVVLLTARASDEERVHALNIQADDYLAKPFSVPELLARLKNLINRKPMVLPGELPSVAAMDAQGEKFLAKAKGIVEANMGANDFDVQVLAETMHMTQATLRRRFQEYMAVTPAVFIRNCRLERANQWYLQGEVRTLNELASKVGFKSASYFTRLYRAQYPDSLN